MLSIFFSIKYYIKLRDSKRVIKEIDKIIENYTIPYENLIYLNRIKVYHLFFGEFKDWNKTLVELKRNIYYSQHITSLNYFFTLFNFKYKNYNIFERLLFKFKDLKDFEDVRTNFRVYNLTQYFRGLGGKFIKLKNSSKFCYLAILPYYYFAYETKTKKVLLLRLKEED